MNLFLKLLKEARYLVFILTVFLGVFSFYDLLIDSSSTYYDVVGTICIILFPVFFVHVLYAIVRARQQKSLAPLEVVSRTTFGLQDSVFILAYLLLALVFVLFHVYTVDELARNKAKERAERIVPSPYDAGSWALPSETLGLDTSYKSFGSLTLENVQTGALVLSTFAFADYNGKNSTGFGRVLVENGIASKCEALPSNSFYTCDTFIPGMIVIKDVVLLNAATTSQIQHEDGSEKRYDLLSQTGLVLAERTYEGVVDTVILYITNNSVYSPNKLNDFTVVKIFSVQSGPAGDISFEQLRNLVTLEAGRYDEVTLRQDGKITNYILEIFHTKYDDSVALLPSDGGIVTRAEEIVLAEPVSSDVYTNFITRKIGSLYFKFEPKTYIWSGRGLSREGYSVWAPERIQRVYFKAACNLPNTFSDSTGVIINNDLRLTLDVSIPQGTDYNVTTTYYGYEPTEWGKILNIWSVAAEQKDVVTGVAFQDRATDLLDISGMPVRHILPEVASRPCEVANSQQMYQWIKDGNLYSVTHHADSVEESRSVQPQIEKIIAELIAGLVYVPVEVTN